MHVLLMPLSVRQTISSWVLNYFMEFNQTCYMTSRRGKDVWAQHYFSIRQSDHPICPSRYHLNTGLNLTRLAPWLPHMARMWKSNVTTGLTQLDVEEQCNCRPDSVGCTSDWWSGGCWFDPCQVGNILSWIFDHEIFSAVNLSLLLIQEGQLSVSGERMCTIPVNRLVSDQACPVEVWLGKLTELDMTTLGWLGRKTSTQTIFRLTIHPSVMLATLAPSMEIFR